MLNIHIVFYWSLLLIIFWIRSNIFRDFSGCGIFETVIWFVFPLVFQCRIPNYSTAKLAKLQRKQDTVQNDGKGGKVKIDRMCTKNFWKRKKATLQTSKIILEDQRVAFLRYDTFALYNVHM